MYSQERVDEGLRVLHAKVEQEMDAWMPRAWDVVRMLCTSDNQAQAACNMLGMVMQNIKNDALGLILKGLPDEPEHKDKPQEERYYDQ